MNSQEKRSSDVLPRYWRNHFERDYSFTYRSFVGVITAIYWGAQLLSAPELVGSHGLLELSWIHNHIGLSWAGPDTAVVSWLFGVFSAAALLIAVSFACGVAPRLSALVLVVAIVLSKRVLSIGLTLDEDALAFALFWAGLTPASDRRVSNTTFAVALLAMYLRMSLSCSFRDAPAVIILLFALLFVAVRSLRPMVGVLIVTPFHVYFAWKAAAPFAAAALASGLIACSRGARRADHLTDRARETSTLDLATVASVVYTFAIITGVIGEHFHLDSVKIASNRLLAYAGLEPLKRPTIGFPGPSDDRITLTDGTGKPADTDVFWPRSYRGRMLARFWLHSANSDETVDRATLAGMLGRTLASRFCALEPRGSSPYSVSRVGDPMVLLSFTCHERGQTDIVPATVGENILVALSQQHTFPSYVVIGDYLGSTECAPCHSALHTSWLASAHGRGMAPASESTVLGKFGGAPILLPWGSVQTYRNGSRFLMDISSNGGKRTYSIDRVLGQGKQQQAYLLAARGGGAQLLPLLWSVEADAWLPVELFYPEVNFSEGVADISTAGCFSCHASQATTTYQGSIERTDWQDPNVNCEACHGPGRRHVDHQRGRGGIDDYAGRSAGTPARQVRRCGHCHGRHSPYSTWDPKDQSPVDFFFGLTDSHVRADGSPWLPAYEYTAFATSRCFTQGGATCARCHPVHSLASSRSMSDDPLPSPSDLHCLQCHAALADPALAAAHRRHDTLVPCAGCHMPRAFIRDDARTHLWATDHAISIPRAPEEGDDHTPNACRNCHFDKLPAWFRRAFESWQALKELPEWLRAVKLARSDRPEAAPLLRKLLASSTTDEMITASLVQLAASTQALVSLEPRLLELAHDPSAEIRGAAILALVGNDVAGSEKWLRHGARDPDPLVRLLVVESSDDPTVAPAEEQRQYWADVYSFAPAAPISPLAQAARAFRRQRQPRSAILAFDIALGYLRPGGILHGQLVAMRDEVIRTLADQTR